MGNRIAHWGPKDSQRSKWILILTIVVLIIFILSLDYLGWIKGIRSPFFTLILGRHAAPDLTEFYKLITHELVSNGVKKRAISGFMDRERVFHVKVELPLSLYAPMAGPLENALVGAGARILSLEASREEDTVFYLWTIQGQGKERMALLFACAPRAKEKPGTERQAGLKPGPRAAGPNLIALIMDDMGNSLEAAKEVCGLGLPLTVSVLPFSPHGTETAQLAHECGLEVILHQPMESQGNNHTEKNTPGMIYASMTDDEIRRTTEDCLEQVPYIRGMNNHMGSKLTEMDKPMSLVLAALKAKNLYFIDSRTSGRSLACDLARTMGVPSGASSMFIDPADEAKTLSAAEIKANVLELVHLAKRNGQAIGIGHPRPSTLKALAECLSLGKDSGVTFVFASRLARD